MPGSRARTRSIGISRGGASLGSAFGTSLTHASDLRDVLRPLFRPTDRIMVVGCGNSTLSQDLVQDVRTRSRSHPSSLTPRAGLRQRGEHRLLSSSHRENEATTPHSGLCARAYPRYCTLRPHSYRLTGRVADATTLADFASGSFDVAIDKGTLDALLCGPGSTERAAAMLASVARVWSCSAVYALPALIHRSL